MYYLHRRDNAAIGFCPAHRLVGILVLSEVESVVMLLLCHQVADLWLKPVVASLWEMAHCSGNYINLFPSILKLIFMLMILFYITIVTNSWL